MIIGMSAILSKALSDETQLLLWRSASSGERMPCAAWGAGRSPPTMSVRGRMKDSDMLKRKEKWRSGTGQVGLHVSELRLTWAGNSAGTDHTVMQIFGRPGKMLPTADDLPERYRWIELEEICRLVQ